jgi:hypothetical protein
LVQCEPDRIEDHILVLVQLIVPDADYAKTAALEFGIALQVARPVGVLAAVEFNDQASLVTGKVGHIGPYGNLPAELEASQTTIPQQLPEMLLDLGRPQAERTRQAGAPSLPLIRPSATFSHEGRRRRSRCLWEWKTQAQLPRYVEYEYGETSSGT